ncbi:MBL fold metallo-hydrolase [Streptomyces sp. NBC_01429]|uniref:MBL fold metallo-hydrolase n=1 Tax=Streptomyces sp. NBC_01429 TaxID=2903862 RepID=UPI002E2A5915|nr:MBL fold metallo-hydrolase [Streptomyces sp. NBC_01429]
MISRQWTSPAARLEEVADGVFAYLQPDGGWCLNNAGVIVADGESALVDTAATEARARQLRDAALTVAPAAPRTVVNTHFHGDHAFGNFVFPEAVVIGHERTRTEMAEAGLHLTGLWPEVHWGELELVLPTLTYQDRMTLHVGGLRAELIHVGPAHTTNDTAVWLPERGVLFLGDLVMSGVTPFCPMGSVSGSLQAVERLRALDARTLVTGHGPVTGPEVFDVTESYLRWLQGLAEEGVSAGLTPLEVARETDLGPYAELLDSERLVPNLHRAYAEERGAAPGVPLDIGALFGEMIQHHGRVPTCHA